MKIFRLLALPAVLSSAACRHYFPADTVIRSTPEIAAIDIVLPTARTFSFADQKRIDPLVSFLRQECHWTAADRGREENKEAKIFGYQIVIRRVDGSQEAIDVVGKEAISAGYHSKLSTSAGEKLDELCGLETVHLGPFGKKKPDSARANGSEQPWL